MTGKIIKGIGGFYYVQVKDLGLLECRARGIFRKDGQKPLVGDMVEVSVLSKEDMTGSVDTILERKNQLIRPEVANVDQVLVIFAAAQPEPNLGLLDRFLVMAEYLGVPAVLCFNKIDVANRERIDQLREIYRNAGCTLLFISVLEREGIRQVREALSHKTTAVAGPSGAGKSSLINLLQTHTHMETGEISDKIQRGRHTTRHSELILLEKDTFIMDTPGFSSLYVQEITSRQLKDCFPEFAPYEGGCRYIGCLHLSEPDCPVKEAVSRGDISRARYDSYVQLQESLKQR